MPIAGISLSFLARMRFLSPLTSRMLPPGSATVPRLTRPVPSVWTAFRPPPVVSLIVLSRMVVVPPFAAIVWSSVVLEKSMPLRKTLPAVIRTEGEAPATLTKSRPTPSTFTSFATTSDSAYVPAATLMVSVIPESAAAIAAPMVSKALVSNMRPGTSAVAPPSSGVQITVSPAPLPAKSVST